MSLRESRNPQSENEHYKKYLASRLQRAVKRTAYSFLPSITRCSLLPTPSSAVLKPVMLHIEEKWRYYLIHVINVPNIQLHTVLMSYLFDDSPKTLQSCKSCPRMFRTVITRALSSTKPLARCMALGTCFNSYMQKRGS